MEDDQQQFVHAQLPVHSQYDRDRLEYELVVRQEPKQARMCGVGADRRPIDPPPIVQLRVVDPAQRRDSRSSSPDGAAAMAASQSFLQNPYYFMFASLAKPDEDVELHWLKDGKTRCTTGSVVSSLYHLKDTETGGADAGFFVFPDLSVRTEGSYRLKLSLFEVVGNCVDHCKSIFSAPFYVYTAKKFPGMEESTALSCSLADQGIKIRIRKDIRARRPKPGGETSIPLPITGPPVPGGAFGPVPVRLDDPVTDEEQTDQERRHSSSASVGPIPETEVEPSRRVESDRDSDRDDPQKRVPARRTSDSTHSAGSRRGGGSERGSKRRRGDSGGGLSIGTSIGRGVVDGPEITPISAGPSSAGTGWGAIDPTLSASSAAAQQSPSTPTSSSADHHYVPAPAAQAAHVGYEHRYSAAPPNASIPAPAPTTPSNYPYDPHPHPPPPSGHHYPAPSAPHAYAHVPPSTPHSTGYPYPSAQQAPPGQSWGYDTYGHSQSYNMPPPVPPSTQSHHNSTHPPTAQRYTDYTYPQQGYGGYYDQPAAPSQHHVQPSPTSHSAPHSYHAGYGSTPTPPSPTTKQAPAAVSDYYAGRGDARSSSHAPSTNATGGGYAQTAYAAPPSAYAPPTSVYSQYSHSSAQGHAPQQGAATTTPSNSQASTSSSGRSHYQLSTPPHHHQTQPYNPYPPIPSTSASTNASVNIAATAATDTNWYPPAPASAPNTGGWGVIQESPYAANYGAAARDAHGPRLAPLRGGAGGTPPPGSVEAGRSGASKKNPLSIGSILSEDTG